MSSIFIFFFFFFFNDTATTEIYTLSLHDALPIPRPGVRFTSGMAPSLVLRGDRPRLVVGSAGSLRLRGAILQVVANVVGHGLGIDEAIERPRVHFDEPNVQAEGGNDPHELDRLAELWYDLVRWRRR